LWLSEVVKSSSVEVDVSLLHVAVAVDGGTNPNDDVVVVAKTIAKRYRVMVLFNDDICESEVTYYYPLHCCLRDVIVLL